MKKIYQPIFIAASLFAMPASYAQNCYDCGTGADGVYNVTSSTTLAGGTYNYTSFTIGTGATVQVTGTQPLIIHCMGKVVINGILDASGGNGTNGVTSSTNGIAGVGVAGGMNGGDGVYSSTTGPLDGSDGSGTGFGGKGQGWSGGGGAGFSSAGASSGGVGGAAGNAYGNTTLLPTVGGSGGGGGSGGYSCGSGGGGAGGGIIVITACDSVIIGINGSVKSNGGNGGSDGTGNCGGGGGGSGGAIWLAATVVDIAGSVHADSGIGGSSTVPGNPYYGTGANGAKGRIRIDANSIIGSGTVSPAAGYSQPPLTAMSANNMNVLCNGDSTGLAVVVASGGAGTYTYSWSPYGGTGQTAANLAAGTFTCTVTDSVGCSTTVTVIITQPPALSLTMSHTNESAVNANDGTAGVTVSGGTGPYTYSWSPGSQTTANITGLGGGTYYVTVTDANGCTQMDSVFISAPNGIQVLSSNAFSVNVFPIPASDVLNIHIALSQNKDVLMEVFDITGKRADAIQYAAAATMDLHYDTKHLADGEYEFRFTAGTSVINQKVMVNH